MGQSRGEEGGRGRLGKGRADRRESDWRERKTTTPASGPIYVRVLGAGLRGRYFCTGGAQCTEAAPGCSHLNKVFEPTPGGSLLGGKTAPALLRKEEEGREQERRREDGRLGVKQHARPPRRT